MVRRLCAYVSSALANVQCFAICLCSNAKTALFVLAAWNVKIFSEVRQQRTKQLIFWNDMTYLPISPCKTLSRLGRQVPPTYRMEKWPDCPPGSASLASHHVWLFIWHGNCETYALVSRYVSRLDCRSLFFVLCWSWVSLSSSFLAILNLGPCLAWFWRLGQFESTYLRSSSQL